MSTTEILKGESFDSLHPTAHGAINQQETQLGYSSVSGEVEFPKMAGISLVGQPLVTLGSERRMTIQNHWKFTEILFMEMVCSSVVLRSEDGNDLLLIPPVFLYPKIQKLEDMKKAKAHIKAKA